MTIEEAIIEFKNQIRSARVILDSGFGSRPGECNRFYRKQKETAEIAILALRAQLERENPEPLTLDELQKLRLKEWVWVEVLEPNACYNAQPAYYQKQSSWRPEAHFACGYPGWSTTFDYCDYGKTWLAYRHKPEEELK